MVASTGSVIAIGQARSQGGSLGAEEPPSQIKGSQFYQKVHYFV